MPCDLTSLLADLAKVVDEDSERGKVYTMTLESAQDIAQGIRAIHKTKKKSLAEIFQSMKLETHDVGTAIERSLGYDKAVYFFLGFAAYPQGNAAFLTPPDVIRVDGDTFTPCDTGAIEKGFSIPRDPSKRAGWDEADQKVFIEAHLGDLSDVTDFAGPYIAAHFHQSIDYVTRGQVSIPDFPPFHGLESTTGDRRAWTIELQLHHDVHLDPDEDVLEMIVIDNLDLLDDIHVGFRRKTTFPDEDDEDGFETFLVKQVQALILGSRRRGQ